MAVTFRIMPEGTDVDLNEIRKGLEGALGGGLKEVVDKPVAFGLVALEAVLLLEDAGGQLERSEEAIRALKGVSSVETLSVDLL
ncbi:MAG: elongation factor 1-beta [Thermoplasmata archaeon]